MIIHIIIGADMITITDLENIVLVGNLTQEMMENVKVVEVVLNGEKLIQLQKKCMIERKVGELNTNGTRIITRYKIYSFNSNND